MDMIILSRSMRKKIFLRIKLKKKELMYTTGIKITAPEEIYKITSNILDGMYDANYDKDTLELAKLTAREIIDLTEYISGLNDYAFRMNPDDPKKTYAEVP